MIHDLLVSIFFFLQYAMPLLIRGILAFSARNNDMVDHLDLNYFCRAQSELVLLYKLMHFEQAFILNKPASVNVDSLIVLLWFT